jgi:cell division protein FtsL
MVELTPNMLGGSFVFLVISYIILFIFNVYVLYLNYKQSKVNDQMTELIAEVKAIRTELRTLHKKDK